MHDRREPILMCATGKKGVGKTYTTMQLIKDYIKSNKKTDKKTQKNNTIEYKTLKSEVMFRSEEAQVLQASAPLGLKVSSEIPQRLQLQVLPNSKGE